MSNSPPNARLVLLSQVLGGYFRTIRFNRSGIEDLLKQLRNLRKEYANLFKDDVILGLLQEEGEGAIGGKLSRERLSSLLDKLIVSFRADQDKSYRFIEEELWKKLPEKICNESLTEGLRELKELRDQLQQVTQERDRLKQERDELVASLSQSKTETEALRQERDTLAEDAREHSSMVQELSELRAASLEYQEIIREVRTALEGKKAYDLWRLKVFYNKVAAMTHSTWSYPGVPKPDLFAAQNRKVKDFLESL